MPVPRGLGPGDVLGRSARTATSGSGIDADLRERLVVAAPARGAEQEALLARAGAGPDTAARPWCAWSRGPGVPSGAPARRAQAPPREACKSAQPAPQDAGQFAQVAGWAAVGGRGQIG